MYTMTLSFSQISSTGAVLPDIKATGTEGGMNTALRADHIIRGGKKRTKKNKSKKNKSRKNRKSARK